MLHHQKSVNVRSVLPNSNCSKNALQSAPFPFRAATPSKYCRYCHFCSTEGVSPRMAPRAQSNGGQWL